MTKSKGIKVTKNRPAEVIQAEKDLRKKVTDFVNDIVENQLFISDLDKGQTMYDSGVDSLDLAEMQVNIEKEFSIKFETDDFNIKNSFEFVITKTIQRIGEQTK